MAELPITPEVIRWARETAGLSIDQVVEKIGRKRVTPDVVLAWEDGSQSPNYAQLERLAYDIYKRPLAIFFFPEPPEETTPRQSFRTLPDYEIELMPARIKLLLRKAKALQLNVSELYEGVNPSDKQIIRDLSFKPQDSASTIAATVRKYLSVDLNRQFKLKSSEDAFKFWREVLEENGIFVFKDAFKEDSFSGFCLYDDRFPVIYVNNSKYFTRQSFTLFHELAHLLFKTGGIYIGQDEYIDHLAGDNRLIEILCNRFAGEFLVPTLDFQKRIHGHSADESTIQNLADTYHVSREVILRKLFDLDLVDQSYYQARVDAWAQEGSGGKGAGGNYYFNMGVYLGHPYIEKAFSRYHQNHIAVEQLADYLGVKVKSVPGMEALLFQKGSFA